MVNTMGWSGRSHFAPRCSQAGPAWGYGPNGAGHAGVSGGSCTARRREDIHPARASNRGPHSVWRGCLLRVRAGRRRIHPRRRTGGGPAYDLVRANALTVVSTALFSAVPLSVFILAGRVKWVSAGILAVGKTAGAYLGVNLAVVVNQRRIKWMLFVMVCLTSASALLIS